jgi:hypothetical protein
MFLTSDWRQIWLMISVNREEGDGGLGQRSPEVGQPENNFELSQSGYSAPAARRFSCGGY